MRSVIKQYEIILEDTTDHWAYMLESESFLQ